MIQVKMPHTPQAGLSVLYKRSTSGWLFTSFLLAVYLLLLIEPDLRRRRYTVSCDRREQLVGYNL